MQRIAKQLNTSGDFKCDGYGGRCDVGGSSRLHRATVANHGASGTQGTPRRHMRPPAGRAALRDVRTPLMTPAPPSGSPDSTGVSPTPQLQAEVASSRYSAVTDNLCPLESTREPSLPPGIVATLQNALLCGDSWTSEAAVDDARDTSSADAIVNLQGVPAGCATSPRPATTSFEFARRQFLPVSFDVRRGSRPLFVLPISPPPPQLVAQRSRTYRGRVSTLEGGHNRSSSAVSYSQPSKRVLPITPLPAQPTTSLSPPPL